MAKDLETLRLLRAIDEHATAGWQNQIRLDLHARIRRRLQPERRLLDSEGTPVAAFNYLEQARHILLAEARLIARRQSSYLWLWMLRRTEREWVLPAVRSQFPRYLRLAEVVSGIHGKRSQVSGSRRTPFGNVVDIQIGRKQARDLVEFLTTVMALKDCHSKVRSAQKGCAYWFRPESALGLPELVDDCPFGPAIRLYDERAGRSADFGNLGTVIPIAGLSKSQDAFVTFLRVEESMVRLPLRVDGRSDTSQVPVRFRPHVLDPSGLSSLGRDPRLATFEDWNPAMAPLLMMAHLMNSVMQTQENSWFNALIRGYILIEPGLLSSSFEEAARRASEAVQALLPTTRVPQDLDELLSSLETIEGSAWPTTIAPPVRWINNEFAFDLCSLSEGLHWLLEFPPVDGAAANARADHFERSVQRLVDESSWRPPPNVARVRGRTLRIDGYDVTDVDALGEFDSNLLLLSCKSKLTGGRYERGDYSLVRNLSGAVKRAVDQWDAILSRLRARPVGDNYDFSEFKEILGVVITPQVVYVDEIDYCSRNTLGLRRASSAGELAEWLRSISTGDA